MRFVGYLRVSTQRQGASGLGLDAQRADVERFVATQAGELVEVLVEVESGRRSDRPQLRAALDLCRVTGASLLIARLDRLARSVRFISEILDTPGVEVRAVDIPSASRMVLHILAAVAEEEAASISSRTRAALAAAKARGVRLGNPNLRGGDVEAARKAVAGNKAAARAHAARVLPYIDAARRAGAVSLRDIASALEARGIRTRTGRAIWSASQIRSVIMRAGDAVERVAA
jgi:DNA invertase Pin-like site-specific DNA recombinase